MKSILSNEEVNKFIMDMPDEVLSRVKFSFPWQYNVDSNSLEGAKDEDGFPISVGPKKGDHKVTREYLQKECWNKYHRNPQVNTSVRGLVGRLTGWGYEVTSGIEKIQDVIDEIQLDSRNKLYSYWPKFVGRAMIEGELFLVLTCHTDGFIEVDFTDPVLVSSMGADDTGIIYHPTKTTFPLFYNVCDENTGVLTHQIPSINIARYPELAKLPATGRGYTNISDYMSYDLKKQASSRSSKKIFSKFDGFNRFIISWDRGFITRRTVSYLRTVLEWLNHYENLKKYEIDHKRSSGAYLWIFSFENPRDFKLWLTLTDEERAKTAILEKKTPGGSLVLPPGLKCEVRNPNLASIKEQDTDIMQMVTSGLNEPADVTTGTAKGTFASVKASRGPMSDRTSDEVSYFDSFQKYDFWGSIFFLKNKINNFPTHFSVREAYDFDENGKPLFKKKKKRPEQLVDISYPISETANFEGRAKGLLGTKHGPVTESLGVPASEVSKRMGLGGYVRMRLRKATEDKNFPELVYSVDAESLQETVEGEVPKKKIKKQPVKVK